MKKLSLLLVACVAAMVLTASAAVAGTLEDIQKRGSLRVGLEPGYMPFELTNQKGEIIGFDVDMAKRMAKAMNVELELVNTAWDGIIPALMTNKFDILMSGMTLTQERNLTVDFAQPYILIGQSVLVNNKLKGVINSYKDLDDPKYTVASKLGTTGEQATKKMIPNAKYISFETEQEGVLEVVNGKVDAFVQTRAGGSIGQRRDLHLEPDGLQLLRRFADAFQERPPARVIVDIGEQRVDHDV